MSEFSSEHAADRLIGAPPGYVGFEAGGELTSAVRQQPFRVVLFDEIEKAHRGVLDKFLQILEDGRLTDGQGTTTHFSECVLIFTSNLGVMRTDPATGQKVPIVEPGTDYDDLERRVKFAISEHFTTEIGRPELLNRLGDNIVVFDFISERVAAEIFELQVENIRSRLMSEHRMRLDLTPAVTKELQARCCANLTHGGRGVGNDLEKWLVNPLARALFDLPGGMPQAVYVEEVMRDDDGQVSLRLSVDANSPR
jgi:ATP-dependent Clp protease ATP-binding subunit ClpA